MMSKIIKNIPVFSLWLAWLVITAHMIIPHDHHLADTFTTKEASCPVSDGKSGNSSGFPIHCHAFNDLTSEKALIYFILENIQHNYIEISSYFNPFTFELHFPGIVIFDSRKPVINSDILELSPLRAPPSLG